MAYRKFLEDEACLKITILYVFDQYKKALNNQLITQLVLQEVDIDYFDFQNCLYELLKLELVRVFKEEKNTMYQITQKGSETVELLNFKLPYILKDKLKFAVKRTIKSQGPKSAIICDFVASEKKQFNVFLKIIENDDLLFEVNINVGSRELALKTVEHFKKNAMDIYLETTKNLMKDV